MIDILGIQIYEADVAITDLILFAESILFAYLLWKQNTKSILLRQLFIILFLSLATSSALGAIFHAFFPARIATTGGFGLWILVTTAIGVTASTTWCINALIVRGRGLFRIMLPFAIFYLATLIYWVTFINHEFITIIMFYLPPLVVFTLIAFFMYLRYRTKAWAYLLGGLILSFTAAAIQSLGISIHPVYFNHNALYHVVQGIALASIFLGARFLLKQPFW